MNLFLHGLAFLALHLNRRWLFSAKNDQFFTSSLLQGWWKVQNITGMPSCWGATGVFFVVFLTHHSNNFWHKKKRQVKSPNWLKSSHSRSRNHRSCHVAATGNATPGLCWRAGWRRCCVQSRQSRGRVWGPWSAAKCWRLGEMVAPRIAKILRFLNYPPIRCFNASSGFCTKVELVGRKKFHGVAAQFWILGVWHDMTVRNNEQQWAVDKHWFSTKWFSDC